ncbi:uncharacterized protein LOC114714806 [Neltuma alba]|uniref:uncharacterized protein LOC114714806 n=1 Tax=Neltuma alba TaxID=207710 RepID=UPI0010A47C1B|nr:uncharacterized protein LOC114714806 [Prosopis alba]
MPLNQSEDMKNEHMTRNSRRESSETENAAGAKSNTEKTKKVALMTSNIRSRSSKRLPCYFHVGGNFVENGDGEVKYYGGTVRVRVIKEGIRLEDLRVMIGEWFGVDSNGCDIKYTLGFNDSILIDLIDDDEVDNLFEYNDSNAHVYVVAKGNENTEEEVADRNSMSKLSGLSQQNDEPMIQDAVECVNYIAAENVFSLPYAVESAPTPLPGMNSLKWKTILLGLRQAFSDADDFKKKLHKFNIANKFEYKYVKNSNAHIYVKCNVKGCPWRISVRAAGKSTPAFLRVTTFKNEHAHNAQDNLYVTDGGSASLTSSIIIEEVRDHIDMRPNDIKKRLQRDYGVKLTYNQAYRAKEKALEDIDGKPDQTYMLIPWICDRLKETDDKTVAKWVAARNNRFERVFIAYRCCIEGFIAGARHVLYIDGSHLSGPYKGTLLSASDYDANNELLPFATTIVKGETLEDWIWLDIEFDQAMDNIRHFNSQLFEWLVNHGDIHKWVLSKFPFKRWDNITTNLAESFNAWMLKERRYKLPNLYMSIVKK